MKSREHRTRVQRLRRAAERQGLTLRVSSRRDPLALDYGGHWLIRADNESGHWRSREIVLGDKYGVSLDEVEAYLTRPPAGDHGSGDTPDGGAIAPEAEQSRVAGGHRAATPQAPFTAQTQGRDLRSHGGIGATRLAGLLNPAPA